MTLLERSPRLVAAVAVAAAGVGYATTGDAAAVERRPPPAVFEPIPYEAQIVPPDGVFITGVSVDVTTCETVLFWSDGTETRVGEACLGSPPPPNADGGSTVIPGGSSDIQIGDGSTVRRVKSDPSVNAPKPPPAPTTTAPPAPAPVVDERLAAVYVCGDTRATGASWVQTLGVPLDALGDCQRL